MKKFRTYLFAFGENGRVREVEVPDDALEGITNDCTIADEVYRYGQFDFAVSEEAKFHRSLSVEDVIEVNGKFYRIEIAGFSHVVPVFTLVRTHKTVHEYTDSLEHALGQQQ